VSKALHWLKLNHIDYNISEGNLASYLEEDPPVVVDYHPSYSKKMQSQQVYMIWKRRMAQQKVLVHL
jgi:hypothetical protein